MLDNKIGLYRFDLLHSMHVLITGIYRSEMNFSRFAVYSNNLDDAYLLALANSHAIYEVDWTNTINPKLIAKYSLLQDSTVHNLWIN